ncbi:MAG: primary-amine oxidase [Solirubrobacterales bacterium]|nr:primary-amine oxidase [Solirubrobacterales bacterium]
MTASGSLPEQRSSSRSHALDPLSPEELRAVGAIVRSAAQFAGHMRFVSIALHEPDKRALDEGRPSARPQAEVVLYDREARCAIEVRVSLGERAVVSWEPRFGVQPSMTYEEIETCARLLREDARWQDALRSRGVEDFSLVSVDPWSAGFTGPEDEPVRRRIARPLTFVRRSAEDNAYARPVENLVCVVDLDRMEVVEVTDHGVVPLPSKSGNYIPELMARADNQPHVAALRDDLARLDITQPDGPSFRVDGHHVSWQKWDLRVGWTPREGLVLHQIGFADGGRIRPIIHRASMSEMYVPYGDPAPMHRNKNAFDEGEYGLGFLANSLELGCDCLGQIHYFDAVVNDQDGQPVVMPNAICMHEEDYGVAWKHTDFHTGHVEVRRSRRLVLSFFATAGNYDYGFFWYFYLDGTIQFETKTTGIISTGALRQGENSEFGTQVAPGLYGPHHQHWFNARLDMNVDGDQNVAYEVDAEPVPVQEGNLTGNAWRPRARLLERESDAQCLMDPLKNRYWMIRNRSSHNGLGQEVGWKLVPGENGYPPQRQGSQAFARAGFCYKHFWVTAYNAAERYAAGDYPAQSAGGDGLPAYAANDRSLVDADLVVWYSFASHHVVRPEDWPVTAVSYSGFHLKPVGFFDHNPAIDVPPPRT